MRIGIITFHRAINYGALLQVYALSQFLREQGHDVKIIDYHRTKENVKIFSLHTCKIIYFMFLRRKHKIIKDLYMLLKKRIDKDIREQKGEIARKQKMFTDFFDKFRDEHLIMTERKYTSPDDLIADPPEMDAYIAGSDQIWGPGRTSFSQAYYLNFGNPETLRISYAPSFGQPSLERSWYPELKKNIERFDAVSVREKSGVAIFDNIGCKAVQVVDPTLLIDDYSSLTKPNRNNSFVFAYRLHQNEKLKIFFNNVLKKTAIEYNLKIKTIAPMDESLQFGEDVVVGIENFLGLIAGCQIMITNSFHGTVFAILHRKKFICIPRVEEAKGQNERIIDLLEKTGLQERYLDIHKQVDPIAIMKSEIDWDSVNQKLIILKEKSIKFITESLNLKNFKDRKSF